MCHSCVCASHCGSLKTQRFGVFPLPSSLADLCQPPWRPLTLPFTRLPPQTLNVYRSLFLGRLLYVSLHVHVCLSESLPPQPHSHTLVPALQRSLPNSPCVCACVCACRLVSLMRHQVSSPGILICQPIPLRSTVSPLGSGQGLFVLSPSLSCLYSSHSP